MKRKSIYQRVLLKISGKALVKTGLFGINVNILSYVATEIIAARNLGVELGLIIGGGNIFRGSELMLDGITRVQADYMGILATIINSLALQDVLEQAGVPTRIMSGIDMPQLAESFIFWRAIHHLKKGRIVIFAAGIGRPYITTDTAAALRAKEIGAQVFLKATMVDGIYDSDPLINNKASKLTYLTYNEILDRQLKIMDATAITLASENQLKIIVFNLMHPGNIARVLTGELIGSCVEE